MIREEFESFVAAAYSDGMIKEQADQVEAAFYAGCQSMFSLISKNEKLIKQELDDWIKEFIREKL